MPFSAGPNIAARPNLVFEYDTGDVQNSYKGEPTTNLLPYPEVFTSWGASAMVIRPDRVMAPDGTLTAYSMYSTSGTYPAISTTITPPNTNPYRGSVWMKSNTGVNQTINFNLFRASPWGLAEQTDITVTPSWARYDVSMTALDTTTHVPWLGRHISSGASVDISIWRAQVENKSHVTPFVVGTRSNTQGLLDVSGYGNTINLANVSFNSSAQMYFDGTDDLITLGSINQYFAPQVGGVSTETVFLITPGASGNDGPLFENYRYNVWYVYGSDLINFYIRTGPPTYPSYAFAVSMQSSIACRAKGLYNHLVSVYETISGGTGKVSLYINGQAAGTSTGLEMGNYPLFDPMIGQSYHGGYGTYRLNGQVPITRVYNSALSAQEVLRNYNQLKGRFNLI